MRIMSGDTQLVMGLHVHVLSPSLLRVPRKTTWGARWQASREAANGAMRGISLHHIFMKESPRLCRNPEMRKEDSIGSLPNPLPPIPTPLSPRQN